VEAECEVSQLPPRAQGDWEAAVQRSECQEQEHIDGYDCFSDAETCADWQALLEMCVFLYLLSIPWVSAHFPNIQPLCDQPLHHLHMSLGHVRARMQTLCCVPLQIPTFQPFLRKLYALVTDIATTPINSVSSLLPSITPRAYPYLS
jgi:hypothetical protein